jgi:hypothetical protein
VHDKDVKPTLEGCAANMLALRLCVEQMLADHMLRQDDPDVLATFIHRLRPQRLRTRTLRRLAYTT